MKKGIKKLLVELGISGYIALMGVGLFVGDMPNFTNEKSIEEEAPIPGREKNPDVEDPKDYLRI